MVGLAQRKIGQNSAIFAKMAGKPACLRKTAVCSAPQLCCGSAAVDPRRRALSDGEDVALTAGSGPRRLSATTERLREQGAQGRRQDLTETAARRPKHSVSYRP